MRHRRPARYQAIIASQACIPSFDRISQTTPLPIGEWRRCPRRCLLAVTGDGDRADERGGLATNYPNRERMCVKGDCDYGFALACAFCMGVLDDSHVS